MFKVSGGVGLYGGKVSGENKLKSGVKSNTMKMVLFILVYIIKLRHIITMINFNIKNTKFLTSVHMHVCVNTHASVHTHLHTTVVLFMGDLIV